MSASAVITPRASVQMRGIGPVRDRADPCTMVIFGAMGDLTKRKLMPALYELMKEGLVDPEFAVLGIGREACDDDQAFRTRMREAIEQSDEVHGFVMFGGDAEEDLDRPWIILFEPRAQASFGLRVAALERFEDRDSREGGG